MHLLMLHGNGGARARFELVLPYLDKHPGLTPVVPKLSGFEGRPLLPQGNYWDLFVQEVGQVIDLQDEDWVLYGHGIGGSLLMEWAARGYPLPNGEHLKPRFVILNSVIGASLEARWFPQLMRPQWVRALMRDLVATPVLQPVWEGRLFQHPQRMPSALRRQFFADYRRCEAFSVFFDLITPAWYQGILPQINQMPFHFLWGEQERVVKAKYLSLWKRDFPKATFELVDDWDHFPMLDQPAAFSSHLIQLLSSL